jgi:hypothetical protein
MINDKDYRGGKRKELAEMNIKELLFCDPGDSFKRAIDYIIANHPIKEKCTLIS